MQRIEGVRRSGLADEIIVEEYEGQKVHDIQARDIGRVRHRFRLAGASSTTSARTAGSSTWSGPKGISSTDLRAERNGTIRIGVVGSGRIASRFVPESRFVSGGQRRRSSTAPTREHAEAFAAAHELDRACATFDELLGRERRGLHRQPARRACGPGARGDRSGPARAVREATGADRSRVRGPVRSCRGRRRRADGGVEDRVRSRLPADARGRAGWLDRQHRLGRCDPSPS